MTWKKPFLDRSFYSIIIQLRLEIRLVTEKISVKKSTLQRQWVFKTFRKNLT